MLPLHDSSIVAAGPRRGDHVGCGVDGNDHSTRRNDFFRQNAIAAAEIENALPGAWGEQFEHRCAELRHEMRCLRVAPRRPVLLSNPGHAHACTRSARRASACRRISDKVVRVVIISGSIFSSMIAARPPEAASSKAGAKSAVRATEAPKMP